jgi:DNA replication ATP-dependent helicase Dna2
MGMLSGQKYVFIGDEHQLPPVTSIKGAGLGNTSIFGYLCDRGAETMLNTTYRMNDVLARWPSQQFYENLLLPDQRTASRRLDLKQTNGIWDHALDPDAPAVFLDVLMHLNVPYAYLSTVSIAGNFTGNVFQIVSLMSWISLAH